MANKNWIEATESVLHDFFMAPMEKQVEGIDLPFIGFMTLGDLLHEKFGFNEQNHEGDGTNGWQVDFWYYYTHPEMGEYCVSGSLAYGEFEFTKKTN
jgi:hypothetical protein